MKMKLLYLYLKKKPKLIIKFDNYIKPLCADIVYKLNFKNILFQKYKLYKRIVFFLYIKRVDQV